MLTQKCAGSQTQLQLCVTISEGHGSNVMTIIPAAVASANTTFESYHLHARVDNMQHLINDDTRFVLKMDG